MTDLVCSDCHARVVRGELDGREVLSCVCRFVYVGDPVGPVESWEHDYSHQAELVIV